MDIEQKTNIPSVLPVLPVLRKTRRKQKEINLSQSQSEAGAHTARVSVHVIRVLIRLRAVDVTSGASSGSAARVTGLRGEACLDKVGGLIDVDG